MHEFGDTASGIAGARRRALGARPSTLGAFIAAAMLLAPRAAEAHDVRPAYLEIQETAAGRYSVLWRTPRISGARLAVSITMPDGLTNITPPSEQDMGDSYLTRWTIHADTGSLDGRRIDFPGLQATTTDVLVRVQLLDGTHSTTLVHPAEPWIVISSSSGREKIAAAYLVYGMKHILFGIDHLLFVLGLLLLVQGTIPLLKTITAFTVAHSITLAIAAFGIVRIAPPPVEAVIALSIVFLGAELVKQQRGLVGLAQENPWVIAFAFGLLHGFGFAVTLTRVGIPAGELPLALLTFNVGVELGQLAFVTVFLAFVHSIRSLEIRWPSWVRMMPGYAIGGVAAFWFIQRVAVFL